MERSFRNRTQVVRFPEDGGEGSKLASSSSVSGDVPIVGATSCLWDLKTLSSRKQLPTLQNLLGVAESNL